MLFAAKILDQLNQVFPVNLVVTQPDRKVGRKQVIKGTPVKEKAVELGIPTFQPKNIKKDHQRIIDEHFDLIIVAAYGQFIPDDVLYHATYQAINVHASLLPKYRGGTPMHRAIINGDPMTGVSIMYMVKKMDAGPVLAQESLPIDKEDNVASLEVKLADLGASLLIETIRQLINRGVKAIPQNHSEATYAYHFHDDEKKIDVNQSAKDCYNLVRGMYPWPIAEIDISGKRMKIYEADYLEENKSDCIGQVVIINDQGVHIQTKDGLFIIKECQLEGKKRMDIQSFMNGAGRELFVLNKAI